MARTIRLDVEFLPEQVYLATSDDVQGLLVQAETIPLLLEYADDIARIMIKYDTGLICDEPLNFEIHEVPYVEAA